MKKIIPLICLLFVVILQSIAQEKDYSLARVGKKIHGIYIYLLCDPYEEYEYIATIKVSVNWTGTPQESFEKAIAKSKKKYPYFNGMIFQRSDLSKVDLIKFPDLGVSRGGFKIGSKASFIYFNKLHYGEVVELESRKDKASIKYINEKGMEDIREVSYGDLTLISDSEYEAKMKDVMEQVLNLAFKVGEKASFMYFDKVLIGEVVSIEQTNTGRRIAEVKYLTIYGEIKNRKLSFIKLTKLTDQEYESRLSNLKEKIDKHKFQIGDKVSFITGNLSGKKQYIGDILSLNEKYHKAEVKYLDENNESRISSIPYLDLTKQ